MHEIGGHADGDLWFWGGLVSCLSLGRVGLGEKGGRGKRGREGMFSCTFLGIVYDLY